MEQHQEHIQSEQQTIDDLINKTTGSHIVEKNKIEIGQINEVYSVRTENGLDAIIRISHGEKSKFETERWAIEQCAKAGVPVPEVLMVDSFELDGKPVHVNIEKKLKGVSMDLLPHSPDLLHQVGEVLSKIHSIETHGFGRLDSEGNGKYDSVRDLLTTEGDYSVKEILSATTELHFDDHQVTRGLEIIKHEVADYPTILPHLIHNDFAPQHIFIDEGKISGIIDFDNANGTDPIAEFSRWNFAYGKEYPLKEIQNGYSNKELFSNDFERKENIWKIYRSLHSLRHNIRLGRQDKVDKFMKSLNQAIGFFS